MKNIKILFLLLFILGCKKENEKKSNNFQNPLNNENFSEFVYVNDSITSIELLKSAFFFHGAFSNNLTSVDFFETMVVNIYDSLSTTQRTSYDSSVNQLCAKVYSENKSLLNGLILSIQTDNLYDIDSKILQIRDIIYTTGTSAFLDMNRTSDSLASHYTLIDSNSDPSFVSSALYTNSVSSEVLASQFPEIFSSPNMTTSNNCIVSVYAVAGFVSVALAVYTAGVAINAAVAINLVLRTNIFISTKTKFFSSTSYGFSYTSHIAELASLF